jgi:hypothetical protein
MKDLVFKVYTLVQKKGSGVLSKEKSDIDHLSRGMHIILKTESEKK